MTFGEKLKEARNERKLTQKNLAETLGVAESSISDWEHDRHKPENLEVFTNLCKTLEVSSSYFLGI
jgi:transcriptional regulator with XRE-family HTH domain